MKKTSAEWSIRMLVDLQDRIDVEAEYQRGSVWSTSQQRLLIDSILRGYDIPKIYLSQLSEGHRYRFEVVDGKQRLTAIWNFFNDKFALARSSNFDDLGDLGGKTASELSQVAHDRLAFTSITVSIIDKATEDEIAELFLRLQKGEPLKAAETRNAIRGPVRDFIANDLRTHPVFPELGLPSKRFGWHELAAITLLLVLNDGLTTIKGADLNDLYENRDFDSSGTAAFTARSLLDDLHSVARQSPGSIRTRWGFVDLFLCLYRLRKNGLEWTPETMMRFFEDFEHERRDVSTLLAEYRRQASTLDVTELGQDTVIAIPSVERDMFAYVESFSREGATAEAIKIRVDVMYGRVLSLLPS